MADMGEDKVIISGVHVDLTKSLKDMVNNKVAKLFRHDGRIIRIRVALEKSNQDEFVANGHIEIGGPDIKARAVTGDLYKSIDDMISKLDRQLVDNLKIGNEK